MITCNCPPPASLPGLECVRCPERFGQIQKVAFQRIMNDDGTKNKFSAVSGFSEINSLANWQARITAADSTKIVISPYIYSPTQESGAARTFGGGNDSLGGVEEIIGREPSTFSASLRNVPQSIAKVLKSLQCENVGVYLIDGNGNVEALGIIDENNNEWIMPIPIKAFFVGDKTHGGIDAPDANVIQWSFMTNYSDDLKIFTITSFSVLSDLCGGGVPPIIPKAYPSNWDIRRRIGSRRTSIKFVHEYNLDGFTLSATIADNKIQVYERGNDVVFLYEGDIIAPADCNDLFGSSEYATEIILENFDTRNMTTMRNMFDNCSSLITLDLSNFNTANVTEMWHAFSNCDNLHTVNISNFDTSNVTDMRNMFSYCYNLETIYGGDWVKNNALISTDMFKNCTSLVGGNGTLFNSNITSATYARIDRAGTPGYFTAPA